MTNNPTRIHAVNAAIETQQTTCISEPSRHASPYSRRSYRHYALAVLTTMYLLNFLDRQILAILQEPLKQELQFTDSQLGLLTGFGFAVLYVMLGLPVARWADSGVRRDIVALALGVWSAMTALCGVIQSYWQLVLARMGVGVGEAGGSPPAYSMISDIFPPGERATAYAIYGAGLNLGILAGFLAGGWINELVGWRAAFLSAGVIGFVFALLLRATLVEPHRTIAAHASTSDHLPAVGEVLRRLWMHRAFRHMIVGTSLFSFAHDGRQ